MTETKPNSTSHQYQFNVEGMTCAACVANVEAAIASVPGIEEISVNLATESARITSTESISLKKLSRAVSKMGYKLEPQGSASLVHRQQRSIAIWKKLLIIQAVFGIPLLVYAMLEMFAGLDIFSQSSGIAIQLVLATILVISGAGYYKRGFKHLILRVPNMDTLVAMGTGAAYVYSIVSASNILFNWQIEGFQTLYFEAAGTILLFITFGKWLEAVAKGKTTEALTGLMDQMPRDAEVYRDGAWQILPLEQVISGDRIRVKSHSKIPVDGEVLSGFSSVDESSISGESLPVEKKAGLKVIGASLNLQSTLEISAEKVGRDSIFGQIINLVEEAQTHKPEIQKLVDRIAAIFVPIVLGLALISGLVWFALGFGVTFAINVMISVLIIACPCALGLATPTALVVGSGIAARGGILIKSADAFQQLSQLEVMVFDKTGTLTQAKPQVVAVYPDESEHFISLAMGLNENSAHPLSKPLLDYGKQRSISPSTLERVEEIPGQGLTGSFQDSRIQVIRIDGAFDLDAVFESALESFNDKGYTVSALTSDEKLLGLIAYSDSLKAEGKSVIQALSDKKINSILLTGDNLEAARQVADEVQITEILANVLPADKHARISELQSQGLTVGMLGDGINDAPALVAADVGLSFRGGTDIARNAADIIFLNDSLNNLIFAHRIAKATISKIHQNLFWAFIYNLAGIPIAMGVLYPLTGTLLNPMFAGMAMAFSSVSVLSNTLLMKSRDFFKHF